MIYDKPRVKKTLEGWLNERDPEPRTVPTACRTRRNGRKDCSASILHVGAGILRGSRPRSDGGS